MNGKVFKSKKCVLTFKNIVKRKILIVCLHRIDSETTGPIRTIFYRWELWPGGATSYLLLNILKTRRIVLPYILHPTVARYLEYVTKNNAIKNESGD